MLVVWSNTRLDEAREWSLSEVADLFLGSPWFRPGTDHARGLRLFITDQEGPIQGVVDGADLAALTAAVAGRTGPPAPEGELPDAS